MKVCRTICLNLFFLILIVHVSARTCEERLESLEDAVQSLIENQKKAATENVDTNPLFKESSRCPNLRKERNLWKRKLEDLEKSLTESNRRIIELETRVSELEFSTQYMESTWSTENSRKKNHKENIKSKTDRVEYFQTQNTKQIMQRGPAQNKTGIKKRIGNIADGNLMISGEKQSTQKGKRLLTGKTLLLFSVRRIKLIICFCLVTYTCIYNMECSNIFDLLLPSVLQKLSINIILYVFDPRQLKLFS